MKSGRIHRIIQILTALQAENNPTAQQLAQIFGTSARTIYRDLNELKTIGVPYHYDPKTGGYRLDPEFFLPPIDLNLQEALALLLLSQKAAAQLQIPFKNSAMLAALKIENNLPPKIRKHCNTTLQTVTTKPTPQAQMSKLDALFNKLQLAIQQKRKVTIRYDSFYEKETIDLELWPYHLFYNNRAWYVIGNSRLHQSLRTFKLNRITDITLQTKKFLDGDDFDLRQYLGRAWSMIPEGRIYHVKLRFAPKVARNVAEVHWHETQQTKFNPDGSADVEFRVDGINEITWWILGYGDQVKVLAPRRLRERIIEIAKNMIKTNQPSPQQSDQLTAKT